MKKPMTMYTVSGIMKRRLLTPLMIPHASVILDKSMKKVASISGPISLSMSSTSLENIFKITPSGVLAKYSVSLA
jgi:hypothetical protein